MRGLCKPGVPSWLQADCQATGATSAHYPTKTLAENSTFKKGGIPERLQPYRDPPQTLGDHLRRRRLGLGLLQKDVARKLCVGEWTYLKWEHDRAFPAIRIWPRFIGFLGYYPFKTRQTLGERLLVKRRSLGLSRKRAARHLGVDEATLGRWERRTSNPKERHEQLIGQFLASIS